MILKHKIVSLTQNLIHKETLANTLSIGLHDSYSHYYNGIDDGGLSHTSYWDISPDSPAYDALPTREQEKVDKIQLNRIHNNSFHPSAQIAGHEIAGTLISGNREQQVVLKVPDNWNGKLVVGGVPGLRNEFANEGNMVPWLMESGYAYICGNKGMTNGGVEGIKNALSVGGNHLTRNWGPVRKGIARWAKNRLVSAIEGEGHIYKLFKRLLAGKEQSGLNTMFSGKHVTTQWGDMMIDMAFWAKARLNETMDIPVNYTYAIGLSNGGYQASRALEIDHQRVLDGKERLFDGGVNWSGVYWPDARSYEKENGKITPETFARKNHLLTTGDKATKAMGWAHDPKKKTSQQIYDAMIDAGYTPKSALLWNKKNTVLESQVESGVPAWGLGYYNVISDAYRAEMLGETGSRKHSALSSGKDERPSLYSWLEKSVNGGWTEESIKYALRSANTGEFSVPMLSLFGDADALLPLTHHGIAYRDAIQKYGNPNMHRLYVVSNGPHMDNYANIGRNTVVDKTIASQLTPMQPYVQKAFNHMVDWVENGIPAPNSKTVETDPQNRVIDPDNISF